jgi:uncharacterized protein (DUF3820 family)
MVGFTILNQLIFFFNLISVVVYITMFIEFGRFKGKSYDEVFEFDRNYLKWVSTQDELLAKYPELNDYIKTKFSNMDMSYQLNFGKYKNRTIKQVLQIDREYLEWLMQSPHSEKMVKLRSELSKIL